MPNINATFGFGASLNGINQSLSKLNRSAEDTSKLTSSSNLIDNIATQIESKHEFSANITVIKAKDETLGTILDLFS